MALNIEREVAALRRLNIPQLVARYAEVFGEGTSGRNRGWLVKRIAWRLQVLAEGDISQRARQRAAELANDADLRMTPPRATIKLIETGPDNRLPPPGTVLTRTYKGNSLEVRVLEDGFEYDGQVYKSLSAVARQITGAHYNGFLFFGLTRREAV